MIRGTFMNVFSLSFFRLVGTVLPVLLVSQLSWASALSPGSVIDTSAGIVYWGNGIIEVQDDSANGRYHGLASSIYYMTFTATDGSTKTQIYFPPAGSSSSSYNGLDGTGMGYTYDVTQKTFLRDDGLALIPDTGGQYIVQKNYPNGSYGFSYPDTPEGAPSRSGTYQTFSDINVPESAKTYAPFHPLSNLMTDPDGTGMQATWIDSTEIFSRMLQNAPGIITDPGVGGSPIKTSELVGGTTVPLLPNPTYAPGTTTWNTLAASTPGSDLMPAVATPAAGTFAAIPGSAAMPGVQGVLPEMPMINLPDVNPNGIASLIPPSPTEPFPGENRGPASDGGSSGGQGSENGNGNGNGSPGGGDSSPPDPGNGGASSDGGTPPSPDGDPGPPDSGGSDGSSSADSGTPTEDEEEEQTASTPSSDGNSGSSDSESQTGSTNTTASGQTVNAPLFLQYRGTKRTDVEADTGRSPASN